MTGNDLLLAIGSASDENLLLTESIPMKAEKNRLWILPAAAAALLVIVFGALALLHFGKGPNKGQYAWFVPTDIPTEEATRTQDGIPTGMPSEEPTQDPHHFMPAASDPVPPLLTEPPGPVSSCVPPLEFTLEGYMVYGTTIDGDRFALESEEQLVDEYIHGCPNSAVMRRLFSMKGGEYYFVPASLPDDAVLLVIIPDYSNLSFLYYSASDPGERYVFEWVGHDDPIIAEDYSEWLASNPYFEKTEDFYISDQIGYCDHGYKEIYLIRDGSVFRAAMPSSASIEEIRAFVDPVRVLLPDPDPAYVDELSFTSVDECLAAIAGNTSPQSVLAGLEGIYTLKNDEGRITGISVKRDTVTVHFSDERGNALYYLTMYRRADPDNAWLIERAQMEELFSFYCDLDTSDSNAMYLVYDMIGHPNIYWLKNGRAFRLYVYFGEYEPDMSQESILELSQVELLRVGT